MTDAKKNPPAGPIEAVGPSPLPLIALFTTDSALRQKLRPWLERSGHRLIEPEAPGAVGAEVDIACVDLALRGSGSAPQPAIDVMRQLASRQPELPIVVLAAERGEEAALAAVQQGAYDFVLRPLAEERLLNVIRRARERRALTREIRRLGGELEERRGRAMLLGTSAAMRGVVEQAERMAESPLPVFIVGERGTGKGQVARAIHDLGKRSRGPFVTVSCSAIAGGEAEAELFGRGAQPGCFERANGGTLFLDEVAELDPATQALVAQAIERGTVRRAAAPREAAEGRGEMKTDSKTDAKTAAQSELRVNVRVISSSHRPLEEEVRQHRFREELFYRLNAHSLRVPALREREGDLPLLVARFLSRIGRDSGLPAERVSADAMDALLSHDWPGNVRELENLVHRAMLACDGKELRREHLPQLLRAGQPSAAPVVDAEVVPLRELERREILKALSSTSGSVTQAARRLGIGRATLYRRLAELNLPPPTIALRNAQAAPPRAPHSDSENK